MPISRQNPFPGMNPYVREQWPDVHLRLINDISNALSHGLPDDLMARTEQAIAVEEEELEKRRNRFVLTSP